MVRSSEVHTQVGWCSEGAQLFTTCKHTQPLTSPCCPSHAIASLSSPPPPAPPPSPTNALLSMHHCPHPPPPPCSPAPFTYPYITVPTTPPLPTPPPPCSPAPFIAGSGPGSVFDFRNIGPGSDPANDPCEYFDLGRNKASTLALSVLGEAWG